MNFPAPADGDDTYDTGASGDQAICPARSRLGRGARTSNDDASHPVTDTISDDTRDDVPRGACGDLAGRQVAIDRHAGERGLELLEVPGRDEHAVDEVLAVDAGVVVQRRGRAEVHRDEQSS